MLLWYGMGVLCWAAIGLRESQQPEEAREADLDCWLIKLLVQVLTYDHIKKNCLGPQRISIPDELGVSKLSSFTTTQPLQ